MVKGRGEEMERWICTKGRHRGGWRSYFSKKGKVYNDVYVRGVNHLSEVFFGRTIDQED